MNRERRGKATPVPADVERVLTPEQVLTLRQMENFGWRMAFVRRPLFQQPVVVITSADGDRVGILEENGELDMQPSIGLRG